MNNCIINEQGNLLEILQEGQEKELQEGQFLVPLSNFYDVLNLGRYPSAIWDFAQEKWTGKGEQRPMPEPQLSEFDKIRIESAQANAELFEMMLSMLGGM